MVMSLYKRLEVYLKDHDYLASHRWSHIYCTSLILLP